MGQRLRPARVTDVTGALISAQKCASALCEGSERIEANESDGSRGDNPSTMVGWMIASEFLRKRVFEKSLNENIQNTGSTFFMYRHD